MNAHSSSSFSQATTCTSPPQVYHLSQPFRHVTIPVFDVMFMKAVKAIYKSVLQQTTANPKPGAGGKRLKRARLHLNDCATRERVHSRLVKIRKALCSFDLRALEVNFKALAFDAPEYAILIYFGSLDSPLYQHDSAANASDWKEVGRILEAHVN